MLTQVSWKINDRDEFFITTGNHKKQSNSLLISYVEDK